MAYTVNESNHHSKEKSACEDTWVPGGGIELPCIYYVYVPKTHNKFIREKLENEEKKLTF